MLSLGRLKPSYFATQVGFVILMVLAVFQVLRFKNSFENTATEAPFTGSTRLMNIRGHGTKVPLNKKENYSTKPLLKSYASTAQNIVSLHAKKMIFKGRPNTPVPTPRTPISPQFQPTPDHVTRPMRPLHFFNHEIVKTTEEILASSWVAELNGLLQKSQMKEVSIVFSSSDYLESLLNWLISAKVRTSPPIDNVIVFCLDRDVFTVLNLRDIPSVYIDPKTVADTEKLSIHRYAFIVWVVRFVVFRLLNYYGYDVISYDTDAIILHNPQRLFDEHRYSDVVGSAGNYPFKLGREWGFTVCLGVILFRSTPKTELLWESINTNSFDDQVMVNYALNSCEIQWQEHGESIQNRSIDGQCVNGLRVTVLPLSNICRRRCNRKGRRAREGLHVWHQLSKKTGADKRKSAQEGGVWFLRSNWRKLTATASSSRLKGNEWLASLSLPVP